MTLTIHQSIPASQDEAARIIAQVLRPLPNVHTKMAYESLKMSLERGRVAAVKKGTGEPVEYHSSWSVSNDEGGGQTVSASVMVVAHKGRGQLVVKRPQAGRDTSASQSPSTPQAQSGCEAQTGEPHPDSQPQCSGSAEGSETASHP